MTSTNRSPGHFLLITCTACLVCLLAGGPRICASDESPLPVAYPVDKESFQAQLTAIDVNWNVAVRTEGGARSLPLDDLVRWGTRVDLPYRSIVLFASGDLLVADAVEIDTNNRLIAQSALWGRIALPMETLRGVLLNAPAEPLERDRLVDRIVREDRTEDQLLLDNRDVVGGVLTALGPDSATLNTAAGEVEISRERITAVVFRVSAEFSERRNGRRVLVGLRDGSLLTARQAELSAGRLRVITDSGVRLDSASDVDGGQPVVCLQPLEGRVTYLSDLRPIGYKHVPYLSLSWPLGVNRNARHGLLRARGGVYSKGLGMVSASRVAYALDGRYQRFAAHVAIDDAAGAGGSTIFRVYVDDGQGNWLQAYESPIVRGGDELLCVSVDVHGRKQIALIVDYADRADELDFADWLDARLVK